MKKNKLKNLLGKLTNFDDDINGTFESLDKEMANVTARLKETITAKTLEQVNDEFKKIPVIFKPIILGFEELKKNLSEREEELKGTLEQRLLLLNSDITNSRLATRNQLAETMGLIEDIQVRLATLASKKPIEIPDFGKQIKETETKFIVLIDELQSNIKKNDKSEELKKLISELEEELKKLHREFVNRISELGGGSMNQKISVNDSVMSSKYADFNIKGAGITATNNTTTKQVDIDFTALAATATLAAVSAASTDAAKSLYTMSAGVSVEYRRSGGATLLYLDETNGRIGIGTNTPTSGRLHIKGSTSDSTANALYIESSTPAEIFKVRNDGVVFIAGLTQGSIPFIGASGQISQNNSNFYWDNNNLSLSIGTTAQTGGFIVGKNIGGSSMTSFKSIQNFVASSGSATLSSFSITDTINQTGSASGQIRGIYINPTLTAVTGIYTALEIATGRSIFNGDVFITGTTILATSLTGILRADAGIVSVDSGVGAKTLFDHTTDANNVTTGETDLYSDTLSAGRLSANGQKILAQYGGTFVGDATSTQRLRAYFGGTLIFDTGALGIGVSTANWDIKVTVIRVSSSVVRCSVALTSSFATLNAYDAYTEVTGLTLANTQILKITGQAAGVTAASDQISAKEGFVQWVPQA